jgi:multidrug efflux pump subunit AcrB
VSRLISFFISRTFLVNLVSVFIIVIGGVLAFNLNRDLIPPMSFKGFSVTLNMTGASPNQIERFAVMPIENSLRGLPKVESIESYITSGSANISVTLDEKISNTTNKEIFFKAQSLLQSIKNSLPDSVRDLEAYEWTRNDTWFMSLALVGFDKTSEEHRTLALKLQRELQQIPGVMSAETNLAPKEIYVHLNRSVLSRNEITVREVSEALRSRISPKTVTSLKKNDQTINITLNSDQNHSVSDLEELVLRTSDFGPAIKLKDIAHVSSFYESENSLHLYSGKEYITFWLIKPLGTDIVETSSKVTAFISDFKNSNPNTGLDIEIVSKGSTLIEQQLSVLKNNALAGVLLVLLVLSYFLGMRIALMAAIGIPIAYLGSVIVLNTLSIDINLISVVAMILVIGILVDDAIIISEKYAHYLKEGLSRDNAALKAASQMLAPITAGIITSMIAFAPILILGGWLTEVLFSIPVVVISSLALSWAEAFFILPNHLKHFVSSAKKSPQIITTALNLYSTVLGKALKYRYPVLLFSVLLVGGTLWLVSSKVKTDFNLEIGPKRIRVFAVLKDSKSSEETLDKIRDVQHELNKISARHPELSKLYVSIGNIWMDGKKQDHPKYASLSLNISEDVSNPSKLESKIVAKIDPTLKRLVKERPEVFERLSVETQMSGGPKEDSKDSMYTIYFSGALSVPLSKVRQVSEEHVSKLKGYVSLILDQNNTSKQWVFRPNTISLKSYGITEDYLSLQLRQQLNRDEIGTLYLNEENARLSLGFSEPNTTNSIDELEQIKVKSSKGISIPIPLLGRWSEELDSAQIIRNNGERDTSVQVKYDPLLVRSEDFEKSLKNEVTQIQSAFPTLKIQTEPSNKQQQKNKSWAMQAILICICAIFFVIAVQLQSIFQPILVCLSILYGFIGATWALYLHGMPLNLMAMIGLLGVAGLSVNSSIVLVDDINRGSDPKKPKPQHNEQIITSATSRFQPILLTTITTICGLFPMAYGIGGDAGFTRPMAFAMGWGVLSSTLLTLFLLPTLLSIRLDFLFWLQTKFKPQKQPQTQEFKWTINQKPSLPAKQGQPKETLTEL